MSKKLRVTATDPDHPDDVRTTEVRDDYVIVCAGTAEIAYVHQGRDGTHVITVKGVGFHQASLAPAVPGADGAES